MTLKILWTFKPFIDGFQHFRPVIQINAPHLYEPYPGILLNDILVDDLSHSLPLAFTIFLTENISS